MKLTEYNEKLELLLSTSKRMNAALAKKRYKSAYSLLKVGNLIRAEIGKDPLVLKQL